MKTIFMLAAALFTCAAFIKLNAPPPFVSARQNAVAAPKKLIISCRPDLDAIDFSDTANSIPLLTGWGSYRMPVTVTNDSASIYFQQGINMYYGFHIIEALASFEKATMFDKEFAMGYWGKALAYGPNINDLGYSALPDALKAVEKAIASSTNCTKLEKRFIAAMQLRYSADSAQKRADLDQLYADAMKQIAIDFPASADAATLYADALMVQHPWDLYDKDYNPKPWTPAIVKVLEATIKRFPANPGAGHYYIHAVEGSKHPEKGLAVANKLGAMMPGLSHLVHMPSHIYIRSGYYNKGIAVNKTAVGDYENYLGKYSPVVNGMFLYLMHNQHMQVACAMMDGQYDNAMNCAHSMNKQVDSNMLDAGGYFGMYAQYVHLSPQIIQVRFGKWNEIINEPAMPSSQVYSSVLSHYARGIAFARLHRLPEATSELAQLQQLLTSPQLKESPPAFNPGIAAASVAEKILQGLVAEESNDGASAIALLQQAVQKEDAMLYNEPKDWLLPARQYLVHALLKNQKFKEAEKVCRQDLFVNPNNPWTLAGLAKALTMQGKTAETVMIKQQLKKATARADVKIEDTVF